MGGGGSQGCGDLRGSAMTLHRTNARVGLGCVSVMVCKADCRRGLFGERHCKTRAHSSPVLLLPLFSHFSGSNSEVRVRPLLTPHFSQFWQAFFPCGSAPSSWPNAPAPDHCGAPAPIAVPSNHLPSLMLTTLPVRRTWACHRLCFRTGCRKASMKSPRAASRTPTRTRTNAARMPRPPASVATDLVSAAERPAGAEPARRTARTACRPTTATARASAPRMAGFAPLA